VNFLNFWGDLGIWEFTENSRLESGAEVENPRISSKTWLDLRPHGSDPYKIYYPEVPPEIQKIHKKFGRKLFERQWFQRHIQIWVWAIFPVSHPGKFGPSPAP
jgi:hypothetical protein